MDKREKKENTNSIEPTTPRSLSTVNLVLQPGSISLKDPNGATLRAKRNYEGRFLFSLNTRAQH